MNTQNNLAKKIKLDYWPFAMGPFTMAIVYILYAFNWQAVCGKHIQEYIHLVLIAAALVIFTATAIKQKNLFHFIMAALCFSFLCRELHFAGTSLGIYIAIAIITTWAISKWKQIESVIEQGKIKPWLYATGFTYILSQLIARRVFRNLHLPNEQYLHVMLEETVETTAHLMMIITAIITFRTKIASNQTSDLSQNQQKQKAVFTKTTLSDTLETDID